MSDRAQVDGVPWSGLPPVADLALMREWSRINTAAGCATGALKDEHLEELFKIARGADRPCSPKRQATRESNGTVAPTDDMAADLVLQLFSVHELYRLMVAAKDQTAVEIRKGRRKAGAVRRHRGAPFHQARLLLTYLLHTAMCAAGLRPAGGEDGTFARLLRMLLEPQPRPYTNRYTRSLVRPLLRWIQHPGPVRWRIDVAILALAPQGLAKTLEELSTELVSEPVCIAAWRPCDGCGALTATTAGASPPYLCKPCGRGDTPDLDWVERLSTSVLPNFPP